MLWLSGCSQKAVPEYQKIMQEQDYIILDVRTKEEYQASHLKEAINIPYDEITKDTKLDQNKYILVYCYSGNRSKIASDTLKEMGYMVYDLGAYAKIDLPKEE